MKTEQASSFLLNWLLWWTNWWFQALLGQIVVYHQHIGANEMKTKVLVLIQNLNKPNVLQRENTSNQNEQQYKNNILCEAVT